MSLPNNLNVILLQIRKPDDPMRVNEIGAFAHSIDKTPDEITTADLIHAPPSAQALDDADLILIGGAGDYSVPEGGDWLEQALDTMRNLYANRKPVFASCWGFQAVAAALGGLVITDHSLAELGTVKLFLTPEGIKDPVFNQLGTHFYAQVGHHDTVVQLPENAIRLASTPLVENHAFRMSDAPFYCTQFHSELTRDLLIQRLSTYPEYTELILGVQLEEMIDTLRETPEANNLIRRFVHHIFGE
ncbi:MAG: type 1 glutamine amidotransferase [Bacteroidetes bacterium]|nr:type 1 glutamine amidotransferase [Bacteroidota bacterium]